jgi:hypothetical protein
VHGSSHSENKITKEEGDFVSETKKTKKKSTDTNTSNPFPFSFLFYTNMLGLELPVISLLRMTNLKYK